MLTYKIAKIIAIALVILGFIFLFGSILCEKDYIDIVLLVISIILFAIVALSLCLLLLFVPLF